MKQSLAGDEKKNFMKIISSVTAFDIHYLSIRPLQEIINFKWETYTKSFFIKQLFLLIGFLVSFLIDIVFMGPYDDGIDLEVHSYMISSIITRSTCCFCVLWFSYLEIK